MAQAIDCFNSRSDAAHTNANADMSSGCFSKEFDSELKVVLQAHTNANADMSSGCFSKEFDSELKVVLQAVLEHQNNILTSQIAARIDEFENKMHTCWSGLQKQMVEQQQKSTRQDERFERFESALANHSDSILSVAKELSALRGDIRAASLNSYIPDEADHEELHELIEQDAFGNPWEAPFIDEDQFSTEQCSSSQAKEENGRVLPFPAKLFAHSGDMSSTPPSLEQLLSLPHGSEGSKSDSSLSHHTADAFSGHASRGGVSNCDVESVLNQNLRCHLSDESNEWSLWSTEPREQLSLSNDSSSVLAAYESHVQSSNLQGANESGRSIRFSGGRGDVNLRIGVDDVRTVMIKNIPCRYSNQDMLDIFAELGFGNETIFFHLPSRYKQDSNLGYAFVGFNNKDITARFAEAMTGYRFKHSSSRKTCVVTPAHIQGMRKNVNHFSQGRKYNPPRLSM